MRNIKISGDGLTDAKYLPIDEYIKISVTSFKNFELIQFVSKIWRYLLNKIRFSNNFRQTWSVFLLSIDPVLSWAYKDIVQWIMMYRKTTLRMRDIVYLEHMVW